MSLAAIGIVIEETHRSEWELEEHEQQDHREDDVGS
jgi:hypothetical protein